MKLLEAFIKNYVFQILFFFFHFLVKAKDFSKLQRNFAFCTEFLYTTREKGKIDFMQPQSQKLQDITHLF